MTTTPDKLVAFGRAMAEAGETMAASLNAGLRRASAERAAVEAVAEWLAIREGNNCFSGARPGHQERSAFRRRAAALLAGEAWAQIK